MGIFERNLTSKLLEKVAIAEIKGLAISEGGKCLEIGCGDFNISGNLQGYCPTWEFCGSDISDEAILLAQTKHGLGKSRLKVGSLFEPWEGEQFDVCISDVASISQVVAELSDWYKGVPCESGDDGLLLFRALIPQVKNFLRNKGLFILPYLSLSDFETQRQLLESEFETVEKKEYQDWPMPANLVSKLDSWISENPNRKYHWTLKEKFGMTLAFTGVYVCKTPRSRVST